MSSSYAYLSQAYLFQSLCLNISKLIFFAFLFTYGQNTITATAIKYLLKNKWCIAYQIESVGLKVILSWNRNVSM